MTNRFTTNPPLLRAIPVLPALLIGGALAAAADLPRPGHYEVTTTTTYTDVPLPDTTVTTQNCLTAADLEKDPASIFAALPEGKSCDIGQFTMENGQISMQLQCTAPDGGMVMTTHGNYNDSGYDMISDVTVTVGGQAVKMQSTIHGTLMGDC